MRYFPKISSVSRRPVWALTWAILAVSPAVGFGQEEVLFDPENPAVETIAEPDAETLFDPENSSASSAESSCPPGGCAPDDRPAPTLERADFLATYSNTNSVDLAWDDQEDVFEELTALRLRLDFERGSSFRAVAEVEFEHWWALDAEGSNLRASYEARPGEAYIVWRQGSVALSGGNMIQRWGATDLTRPTDVINPVDLTVITPDRAQRRIPQLMAQATWGPETLRITALVVPFFVPNRTWAFGRDTAAFSPTNPAVASAFPVAGILNRLFDASIQDDVQPALSATSVPDEVPSGVSAGARITTTFANTDLALGYFLGWDRTPSVVLDPNAKTMLGIIAQDQEFLGDLDFTGLLRRHPELLGQLSSLSEAAAAGKPIFESTHDRLHTLAFEATRYLGPIGVRMDVAFHPQKTYLRPDFSSVRTPTLAAALGLSYEDLVDEDHARVLSVEGFITEPFDDDEYLVVGRRSMGVASALQWTMPLVDMRLVSIVDLSNASAILTFTAAHRFAAWLRVSAGITIFEPWGDDKSITPARILDANDFASITVDGAF